MNDCMKADYYINCLASMGCINSEGITWYALVFGVSPSNVIRLFGHFNDRPNISTLAQTQKTQRSWFLYVCCILWKWFSLSSFQPEEEKLFGKYCNPHETPSPVSHKENISSYIVKPKNKSLAPIKTSAGRVFAFNKACSIHIMSKAPITHPLHSLYGPLASPSHSAVTPSESWWWLVLLSASAHCELLHLGLWSMTTSSSLWCRLKRACSTLTTLQSNTDRQTQSVPLHDSSSFRWQLLGKAGSHCNPFHKYILYNAYLILESIFLYDWH